MSDDYLTIEIIKANIASPDMTFEEIGKELGISTTRAYQIYKGAMAKLKAQMTDEDMEDILEALQDADRSSQFEAVVDTLIDNTYTEDLRGFWNERELCGKVTSTHPQEGEG